MMYLCKVHIIGTVHVNVLFIVCSHRHVMRHVRMPYSLSVHAWLILRMIAFVYGVVMLGSVL